MSEVPVLSPLIAVLVGVFVLLGALTALIGSIGLVRLASFRERIHPPTMGTTLGAGFILIGSMLLFSALESRPVVHEIVIALFVVVTTPVTYMLLLRAARVRDLRGGYEPDGGNAAARRADRPGGEPDRP